LNASAGPETGDPPAEAVRGLLRSAGWSEDYRLVRLEGGANNRVYRLESGARSGLLKRYFRHAGDARDRLGAEWGFSSFAWRHGVRALPEPLAANAGAGLALYAFVEGRKLLPGEVAAEHVRQAWRFYADVNVHRVQPDAAALSEASEACFSVDQHLHTVERRVERLRALEPASGVNGEAAALVREALAPAWERVAAGARRAAKGELAEELRPDGRRLSPSDFGFHNALLPADGRLRFLDFEYAGWDDPAKTVCDFFCQVAVPVPFGLWDEVVRAAARDQAAPEHVVRRCQRLLPVYRVKWVCIVLNEFLAVGARRRAFAGESDGEARKQLQLEKARRLLAEIL